MNVTNVPIFNAFKKCSEVISGEREKRERERELLGEVIALLKVSQCLDFGKLKGQQK